MSFFEVLRAAAFGVLSNKLRSALTMLGVMIGVASVILLLAVGNGSAQQVNDAITSLGTNTLTVRSSGFTRGFGGGNASGTTTTAGTSQKTITMRVAQDLASSGLGHVATVVPQSQADLTVSSPAGSQTGIPVIGTTQDYFAVTTAKVASGPGFTTADVSTAAKKAVIGQGLAASLFPSSSALGQTITLGGTTFTVTGILAEQGASALEDSNSIVIAPITRIQRSFTGFDAVSTITVAATSADAVPAAQGELEVMLNQLLGISNPSAETYTITNQSSLLATRAASAASFTVLLGAVAAISLLVGGIGVTNVMLVAVTERTREIGIRKALGASRASILGQFLTEAATLTLIGGIFGVAVALAAAQIPINGTQPAVLGFSIPLALGVSVAIGVFFGVYPAAAAARLRPIQALRAD
ncbi:ABC transporter permease [Parafrigoribacterium mesophilum]|uniref:ABC transporter permease n=1 Tax=Parafrigoribacterium mesophilum TaxID=433646 RepID=UPI0031FD19E6